MTEKIFKAIQFAAKAHHEQRRKSSTDPYIIHPIRVGYLALDSGMSENAVIAALLHDVVEDCGALYSDILIEFGPEVSIVVELLTKWWSDYIQPEEKAVYMRDYYDCILQHQDAICIKMLDRIDNLKDMSNDFPNKVKWARKYLAKTEKEFVSLYDKCQNEAIKVLFTTTVNDLKKKLESFK